MIGWSASCPLAGIVAIALRALLWTGPVVAETVAPPAARPDMTVQLMLPPGAAEPADLISRLDGAARNPLAQNVALLLLTALVTGLAVPRVKARMDLRYFREQKEQEAELARQASRITEQTEFLKSYIAVVWRFHFNLLEVTYAKASGMDPPEFEALWAKYGPESWACLRECRRLTSSAIHLVSKEEFAQLLAFYRVMLDEEAQLSTQVERRSPSRNEWFVIHQRLLNDFAATLDAEIERLARDLKLTGQGAAPNAGMAARPR